MKITLKQYSNHEILCTNIDNAKAARDWRNSLMFTHEPYLVSRDNRVAFKKLFGRKPDWYWRGEFHMHVWVEEHNDDTFLIFTAKEKGTCIEIVQPEGQWTVRESKGQNIVSFLQSLHYGIKGVLENV